MTSATRAPTPGAPSRAALVLAATVGALAALTAYRIELLQGVKRDIDQVWFAARAALAGHDPYALIGPGLKFDWAWHLYYPGTAVVAALPLAPFPMLIARYLFVAVTTGLLVYALTRHGLWRLGVLLSPCYLLALLYVQWSPLYTAALFLPALAVFVTVKPTIGLAILAGSSSRTAFIAAMAGTVVLVIGSFVLMPGWVPAWRDAVAQGTHLESLMLRPGGIIVLLAAFRWRRPEARLLLVLAAAPQTPYLYDVLPLLAFVPARRRELAALVVLSWLVVLIQSPFGTWGAFPKRAAAFGTLTIWCLYVPTLLLILRRPNVGSVPAWAERLIARWLAWAPEWLRGRPVSEAV